MKIPAKKEILLIIIFKFMSIYNIYYNYDRHKLFVVYEKSVKKGNRLLICLDVKLNRLLICLDVKLNRLLICLDVKLIYFNFLL